MVGGGPNLIAVLLHCDAGGGGASGQVQFVFLLNALPPLEDPKWFGIFGFLHQIALVLFKTTLR